jgi:hypothetical protein
MFDLFEPGSIAQALATLPEFLWEASLAVYLTVKGFQASSPILDGSRNAAVHMGWPTVAATPSSTG